MNNGPRGRRTPGGFPNLKNVNKNTIKRLLSYIFKNHKGTFFLILFCILLSSIGTVANSIFLEKLIDDYIEPMIGISNPVFDGLLRLIGTMIVIYVTGVLATLLYNILTSKMSQSILKEIRNEMFEHMQKLEIEYFDNNTYGEIMSYYINDTDTLREMISRTVPQFISSAVTILAVFIAMIYTSIYLTILVIIFIVIMFIVTAKIGGKSGKYFKSAQESLANLNGYIEEMINGEKVVKVFTHEDIAIEKFDELNNELCINFTKANQYANILMPILNNIGHIEYASVGIFGGIMALNNFGGVTLGCIASFIGLSKNFLNQVSQISNQVNSIVMALAGAERIFTLMDEKVEEDNGTVTLVNVEDTKEGLKEVSYNTGAWAWKKDNNLIKLEGKIEINDVTFSYEEGKEVLHNISLYAKPGQKIAFVGATGAGKTTITNLINRFYDIDSGTITYDGIDIKDIKKKDLRKSLGMVLQDVNLFSGTIKENIKYGVDDATDEDIVEAAKLANAHDFIMRLPQGYDTELVSAGENLSGGQKQLLSIARAALSNPPVMILDEATSNIDTRTEKLIAEGMDKLMEGRTVLVIAHRLSTIRNAKAIMVLDHGKIIERGEHEYLMGQKGEYYELYTGKLELD